MRGPATPCPHFQSYPENGPFPRRPKKGENDPKQTSDTLRLSRARLLCWATLRRRPASLTGDQPPHMALVTLSDKTAILALSDALTMAMRLR